MEDLLIPLIFLHEMGTLVALFGSKFLIGNPKFLYGKISFFRELIARV